MKNIHIYSFVWFALLLLSCSRSVEMSSMADHAASLSANYREASTRHYQLTRGQATASDQEWLALIAAFQRVIDADAQGEWTDDAQYAIASCWMWLRQNSNNSGATQQAIHTYKKLLQDYPNSPYAAEAHYWIGNCHELLGDDLHAVTYYQTVIRRYLNHPISDDALFHLGRVYERGGFPTSAIATYQLLSRRSKNPQIALQTKERIVYLQAKEVIASKVDASLQLPDAEWHQPGRSENPAGASSIASTAQGGPSVQPTNVVAEPVAVPTESPAKPADEKVESSFQEDILHDAQEKPVEESQMPSAPSLVQQLGLNVRTIVIDPGHGGKDPGAVSKIAGQEKRIVLNISEVLRDLLFEKGYQVWLTRDTDDYIPLKERTEFATAQEADLFISIHVNSSNNADAEGIETYSLDFASDESARLTALRENVGTTYSIKELDTLVSKILKESKRTESLRLAQTIQEQLISGAQATDRGVKHAPFVVLIGTKIPAVLIEVGFLSNPTEAKKLITKDYQRQLAEAIVKGIEQYITTRPLANAM